MNFYIGSSFKNAELVNYFSKELEKNGWKHTYNWAENINDDETVDDMIQYSILEQNGISNADVFILILPAGRGSHIELGMALAFDKKICLCSTDTSAFDIENTVNFYEFPHVKKIVGNVDDIIDQIINMYE